MAAAKDEERWPWQAALAIRLIEKLGWPLAVILGVPLYFTWNASEEQQHRMVENLFFPSLVEQRWLNVVLTVLFVLAAWAIWADFDKRLRACKAELRRVGEEKSRLQAELAGRDLEHVDDGSAQ